MPPDRGVLPQFRVARRRFFLLLAQIPGLTLPHASHRLLGGASGSGRGAAGEFEAARPQETDETAALDERGLLDLQNNIIRGNANAAACSSLGRLCGGNIASHRLSFAWTVSPPAWALDGAETADPAPTVGACTLLLQTKTSLSTTSPEPCQAQSRSQSRSTRSLTCSTGSWCAIPPN